MTTPPTHPHVALCGTGVALFVDEDTHQMFAVPLHCHRWDCDHCSQVRMRAARAKALAGKPERLLTLTTRPREGLSLEAAIPWLRKSWTLLLRKIRKEYPRIEYMAFVELHKSRWPHMHILTRGAYIEQRRLASWWQDITGSFKVHIQKIRPGWHGIQEATKYYLKTARQVHEAAPSLPVYTMSRHWLPADWHEGKRPPGNRTFYMFLRTSLDAFADFIAQLGGSLDAIPNESGHYQVNLRGPPDPVAVDEIYYRGDPAQVAAICAIDQWFTRPHAATTSVSELADQAHYYADTTNGFGCSA